MEQIVWQSTLDGRYEVTVYREREYGGRLEMVDTVTQEVVLRQHVGLSYDALFGPDTGDVSAWQMMAMEAADARA